MTTVLEQFECEDGCHRCVIEDNGRVAYAYLIHKDRIIGDLWLYNQAQTPEEPEWRDRMKMPFLNSKAYVDFTKMANPLDSVKDIFVKWKIGEKGLATEVHIYLRGYFYGVLAPLTKPGWCIAALRDGPLAKRLSGEMNQP